MKLKDRISYEKVIAKIPFIKTLQKLLSYFGLSLTLQIDNNFELFFCSQPEIYPDKIQEQNQTIRLVYEKILRLSKRKVPLMTASLPPLFFKKILHFFLIIVLVNSVGCAARYNPLQSTWTGEAGQEKETNPILKDCRPTATGTLYPYSLGVHCTERVRDAYLEAGVDDALLSDATAFALIPLSLAAIGVGVAGVNGGNTLTGLALGSATLLGWGTWMTSPTRRDLYGLGAQAMSCVIGASESLNIPQTRIANIQTNRAALVGAFAELKTSIGNIKDNEYAQSASVKVGTTKNLNSANTTLNEANQALKTADLAIDTFSRAGQTVWNATMGIHSRIVSEQLKNANDLRNFSDFLAGTVYGNFQNIMGLSAASTSFGKKEKSKDSQELQSESEEKKLYNNLIEALHAAQEKVVSLIVRLNADLQSITVTDLNASFAKCLNPLDAFQHPKPLKVSPSAVFIKPEKTQNINITSGTPPFSISQSSQWPDSVNLSFSPTLLSGLGSISIQAGKKDKGKEVTFLLNIEDSLGNPRSIPIIVSDAADPTSEVVTDAEKDGKTPENSVVDALNGSEEFKPEKWAGGTLADKWKVTLENGKYLFSFVPSTPKEDNSKLLERLRQAAGVSDAKMGSSGDIELRITEEELKTSIQAIKTGTWLHEPQVATPIQISNEIEQMNIIKNTLNAPESSVNSKLWEKVLSNAGKPVPWKVKEPEDEIFVFYLAFENNDAAEAANNASELKSKLTKFGQIPDSFEVKTVESELTLFIPKDLAGDLIKLIEADKWP